MKQQGTVMKSVLFLSLALWVTLGSLASSNAGDEKGFKDFLGKTPPEIESDADSWFNIDGDAPKLENLKDKVVLLEFTFTTCHGCLSMIPQMKEWQKKYAEKGLVILDIDNGREDSLDHVQDYVEKKAITYPILRDLGGVNCDNYGVEEYPALYLLAPNDKGDLVVVWQGAPVAEGAKEKITSLIEAHLAKLSKKEEKPVEQK